MKRAIERLLNLARAVRWGRVLAFVAVLVGLYYIGQVAGERIMASFDLQQQVAAQTIIRRAVILASILYVILLAVPFMPGIEVGLSLMMLLGAKVALLVYLCTIAALMLAFLTGRFIPVRHAARAFRFFGLARAEELLLRIAALPVGERLDFLRAGAPGEIAPMLLRHRYLALAVLINLPGNMLVGGGGGIALVAGMTRLFSWPAFLLTVAVAVAPVPILIYFAQYS
ncbi:MAG TPA: hypothetical protein VKN63_05440 [Afifellaceae bacterium]|nr:hypothetical protein [Afifellaceae bacterium]